MKLSSCSGRVGVGLAILVVNVNRDRVVEGFGEDGADGIANRLVGSVSGVCKRRLEHDDLALGRLLVVGVELGTEVEHVVTSHGLTGGHLTDDLEEVVNVARVVDVEEEEAEVDEGLEDLRLETTISALDTLLLHESHELVVDEGILGRPDEVEHVLRVTVAVGGGGVDLLEAINDAHPEVLLDDEGAEVRDQLGASERK